MNILLTVSDIRITDAYLSITMFWYLSPLYKELTWSKCFRLLSVSHDFRVCETILRNYSSHTEKPVIPKLYLSVSHLEYYSPKNLPITWPHFSLLRLIWCDTYPQLNLHIYFIHNLFLKGKERKLNYYSFLSRLSISYIYRII
jgi:hypothetical protein